MFNYIDYINRIITSAQHDDIKSVLAICEEALREYRVSEANISHSDKERRRVLLAAIKEACKTNKNSVAQGIGVFNDAQSWTNGHWGVWLEGEDRLPELPVAPGTPFNMKSVAKINEYCDGQEIDLEEIDPDKVAAVIRERDIQKKMAGKDARKQLWPAYFNLGEGRPMYNAEYLMAAFKVLPGYVERAVVCGKGERAPLMLYSKSSFALIMHVVKKG